VQDNDSMSTATGVTEERLSGLRRWNVGLTVLHLAQAVVVVVLAGDFAITVTSSIPEGHPEPQRVLRRRCSRCRSGGPLRSSCCWRCWTTC
jgi:hypothetical protein